MTMMMTKMKSLIDTMKQRQLGGIRRQTEQLDPTTRQQLHEFLEDLPSEVEDWQTLNDELDVAQGRLSQLKEKEAFVGQRLINYRRKLDLYQERRQEQKQAPVSTTASATATATAPAAGLGTTADGKTDDDEMEKQKKNELEGQEKNEQEEQEKKEQEDYESHVRMLKSIEASHRAMQDGIETLQDRIEWLERRQCEIRHLTEECQVVYETTEALATTTTTTTTTGNVRSSNSDTVNTVEDPLPPTPVSDTTSQTFPPIDGSGSSSFVPNIADDDLGDDGDNKNNNNNKNCNNDEEAPAPATTSPGEGLGRSKETMESSEPE